MRTKKRAVRDATKRLHARRVDVETLMNRLLHAVHAQWPEDRTRPGLVVSYLARDGAYYVSIVRYTATGPNYYDHKKCVVVGHKRPSLLEALLAVATDFVGMQSAKEDLRELLAQGVALGEDATRAFKAMREAWPVPDGNG